MNVRPATTPSDGTLVTGETCMPGRGEVLVRSPSNGDQAATAAAAAESNPGRAVKSKSGTFESPNWSRQNDLEPRCVYRFIADVGEKVHVKFDRFQLRGEMPYCSEDFLDVYVDVASSSMDVDRENALLTHLVSGEPHTTTPFSAAVYSTVLDRSALLGRFCEAALAGSPVEFISLHREIVLDFYTGSDLNALTARFNQFGFNGTFEFIQDCEFPIAIWKSIL
ncbi:unnamed protein product [Echinostoma caproni]|uniref:CUB domain-containing protein n=1 Tax=Echinostoma caproni TaxID=27848 RepID=A0A183AK29_9TREM|nr:unnamed protein product [Echinostoma caproni]